MEGHLNQGCGLERVNKAGNKNDKQGWKSERCLKQNKRLEKVQ